MLYLHIGLHKTGTSSIQASLFASRPALHKAGIDYYGRSENHSDPMLWSFSSNRMKHPVTVNARLSEAAVEHIEKDVKAELATFLEDRTYPIKIISGEEISNLKRDDLVRLKEFLDQFALPVRIIVYVRNYYDYLSSQVQELVKWGWAIPTLCEDIKSGKRLHPAFRRRIEPSIELFGRENVDIRVFHPTRLVDGDLLTDFCVAIGAKSAAKSLNQRRVNESLTDTSIRALSDYNLLYPTRRDGTYNSDRSELAKRYIAGYPGSKFVFDDDDVLTAYKGYMKEDADFMGELLGAEIKALMTAHPPTAVSRGSKHHSMPNEPKPPLNELTMKSFGRALLDLDGAEAVNEILTKLFVARARGAATREFVKSKLKFIRSDAMCRKLTRSLCRAGLFNFARMSVGRALEIDAKDQANIELKAEVEHLAEKAPKQQKQPPAEVTV